MLCRCLWSKGLAYPGSSCSNVSSITAGWIKAAVNIATTEQCTGSIKQAVSMRFAFNCLGNRARRIRLPMVNISRSGYARRWHNSHTIGDRSMNANRRAMLLSFVSCLSVATLDVAAQAPWQLNDDGSTTLEASRPIQVVGRNGLAHRKIASRGEVLGAGWGSDTGDFAELFFRTPKTLKPARIRFKYARDLPGSGWLDLILDSVPIGRIRYENTGGDGSKESDYQEIIVGIPELKADWHRLYVTAVADGVTSQPLPEARLNPSPILDQIGNRGDKNSVGHGRNLALYTGRGDRKRFFFATHELGNIFSATDGETINWYPDHVLLEGNSSRAGAKGNVYIDHVTFEQGTGPEFPNVAANPSLLIEQRQVCVTKDDVVVSQIWLSNRTGEAMTHRLNITGDCRRSFDWREQPTGERSTIRKDDRIIMVDRSVFPDALPNGLCMAIGANVKPSQIDTKDAGAYRMSIDVTLKPGETRRIVTACALERSNESALANLNRVLKQSDPIAENRSAWEAFYTKQVPRFQCSDPRLTELYGFRWFLLRFSTAGGDLGYFKYPVVMEGRQAYQTYCCYSAPFMAFDMNWAVDPMVGFGHIANMAHAAYEDGRFPWYTSPRTNKVKLDHDSRSGLSLLPWTAWQHYKIHQDKKLIADIYPAMKKNAEWWLADRDPNNDRLFDVSHQLETGQDDLFRWGHDHREMRYDAVDATSYAALNMQAVAHMARTLGNREDAARFTKIVNDIKSAMNGMLWDASRSAWFDRHPKTKQLATHYPAITMFYPFMAGVGGRDHLDVFRKHLLNPSEFWLKHPVPALPENHPEFGPRKFWEGPAWPAATCHVIEAFISAAKSHDRSLLPQAAELFRRAAGNHLQPRADFYERYNPRTGDGLSLFRDYMHSWWVDLYVRHVAGLTLADDGSVSVDPLPLGLSSFSIENVPLRGKHISISWKQGHGLEVRVNGTRVIAAPNDFVPGKTSMPLDL